MLKNLSDRSNALLDPNFMSRSTKLTNKEWRVYKEAEEAIRSSGFRGEDWDQLRRTIESNEKRVQQLQERNLYYSFKKRSLSYHKACGNISEKYLSSRQKIY
jgi:hypothetical protein